MENVRKDFMPVGQVVKINYKTEKIREFIKRNKVILTITTISLSLLITEGLLINQFIKLLAIL